MFFDTILIDSIFIFLGILVNYRISKVTNLSNVPVLRATESLFYDITSHSLDLGFSYESIVWTLYSNVLVKVLTAANGAQETNQNSNHVIKSLP